LDWLSYRQEWKSDKEGQRGYKQLVWEEKNREKLIEETEIGK